MAEVGVVVAVVSVEDMVKATELNVEGEARSIEAISKFGLLGPPVVERFSRTLNQQVFPKYCNSKGIGLLEVSESWFSSVSARDTFISTCYFG